MPGRPGRDGADAGDADGADGGGSLVASREVDLRFYWQSPVRGKNRESLAIGPISIYNIYIIMYIYIYIYIYIYRLKNIYIHTWEIIELFYICSSCIIVFERFSRDPCVEHSSSGGESLLQSLHERSKNESVTVPQF